MPIKFDWHFSIENILILNIGVGTMMPNKISKPFIKLLFFFVTFFMFSCANSSTNTLSDTLEKKEIYQALTRVSHWQWQQFNEKTNLFEGYDNSAYMDKKSWDTHPQGWVYAALFVGMAQWAKLADSQGDDSHFLKLKSIAKRNQYLIAPRIYNADDYAIGQLYIDLYEKYHDKAAITPIKTVFDIILNSPATGSLTYKHIKEDSKADSEHNALAKDEYGGREIAITPCKVRWCWADALFMGPPVWLHLAKVTGEQKYAEFANKEFWQTANLLWDKEDHLFFRDTRFFERREKNGEKVIWARGVGWVVAGLARMLQHIPKTHPHRAAYEDIFKKVMARLASAQQDDGFWRPSVLAPESQPYKESSGTGLMAFAFASGINQGLLPKERYLPVVRKAWSALISVVQPNGKLGWVQPIGASPDTVSAQDTQLYGVGAFLLTGTELYKMLDK